MHTHCATRRRGLATAQRRGSAARSQAPTVVEVKAPCKAFGDVHGQRGDLLEMFKACANRTDAGRAVTLIVCVCVCCVCVCFRPRHHAHRPPERSIARARHRARMRAAKAPNHAGCGLPEGDMRRPTVPRRAAMPHHATALRRRYGSPNHVKGDIERMRYVFVGDFADRPSPPRPTHAHTNGSQRGAARRGAFGLALRRDRCGPRLPPLPMRPGSRRCIAV